MGRKPKIFLRAGLLLVVLAAAVGFLAWSARHRETAGTEEQSDMAAEVFSPTPSLIPTPEATKTPTPTPDPYPGKPDVNTHSWEFLLANPWRSVETYQPKVKQIEGIELDERIIEPMQRFVADARAQGYEVILASGYRGYDEQKWLFDMKVAEEGEEKAATIVARPGTSEHQTGLAADITDGYYDIKKPEILEQTGLYQWMSTHCQDYGFIVRYPDGKKDITGIIYEPWHFRYVGVPAATYIMENDLTLEEFLERYE